MVVESHDDFPGVEISIAGGVGEMVRDQAMEKRSYQYKIFTLQIFYYFTYLYLRH